MENEARKLYLANEKLLMENAEKNNQQAKASSTNGLFLFFLLL
jgi:hypothetical protein